MNFIISKLANYVLILDKLQNGMSDPSHVPDVNGMSDPSLVPDVQTTYHSSGPEKSWIVPSTE